MVNTSFLYTLWLVNFDVLKFDTFIGETVFLVVGRLRYLKRCLQAFPLLHFREKESMINQAKMPRDSAVPSLFPPFFAHSLFLLVSRFYISSALTVTLHWHRLTSVKANNIHMFFYRFMPFTMSLSTIKLHNVDDANSFTIINLLCYNLVTDSK